MLGASLRACSRELPGRHDTSTEGTQTGTGEAVLNTTNPKGSGGTHLILKTEKKTIDVHVGPSWYLAEKQFRFAEGDEIEVTGSRAKFNSPDIFRLCG